MAGKLNVGIIGVGNRSIGIIKAINNVPGMTVKSIADVCEDSIKRAKTVLKGEPYITKDYKELLKDKDIDGIIVITPNYMHADMAVDVIKSNKPLYLEKPMSVSKEECQRIIDCAEKYNAKIMVGMQLRYSDVFRKMKKICDSGIIGNILTISFKALRGELRPGWESWRMNKDLCGNMILEISVHQLDLFNWFAGSKVRKTAAFGGGDGVYKKNNLLDNAVAIIEYENNVRAVLQASLSSPQGADEVGMCIVGEKGTLYQTKEQITIKLIENKDIITITTTGYDKMDDYAMKGFMDYILKDEKPLTCPYAGRDAVALGILIDDAINASRCQ